jgi:hypothetical protein
VEERCTEVDRTRAADGLNTGGASMKRGVAEHERTGVPKETLTSREWDVLVIVIVLHALGSLDK